MRVLKVVVFSPGFSVGSAVWWAVVGDKLDDDRCEDIDWYPRYRILGSQRVWQQLQVLRALNNLSIMLKPKFSIEARI